jgi:hypothetical protein
MWIWEDDFASRAVPLFNRPRIYVIQCHISHLYEECFGITFMLAIYLKMLCLCLVFKLYSRRAKDKCGRSCWWSLNSKFHHHLLHEKTWNELWTIAIGFDFDKFHEFWCFHCLAGIFNFHWIKMSQMMNWSTSLHRAHRVDRNRYITYYIWSPE